MHRARLVAKDVNHLRAEESQHVGGSLRQRSAAEVRVPSRARKAADIRDHFDIVLAQSCTKSSALRVECPMVQMVSAFGMAACISNQDNTRSA